LKADKVAKKNTQRIEVTQIVKQVKLAIVSIGLPQLTSDGLIKFNISGTGFNVKPDGLVITCQHVIEPFLKDKQLLDEMVKNEGQIFDTYNYLQPVVNFYFVDDSCNWSVIQKSVSGIEGDIKDDIAILSLFPGDFRPGIQKYYPCLEFDSHSKDEGFEIGTGGFPLGDVLHEVTDNASCSFHFGRIGAIIPYNAPNVKPSSIQLDVFTNHGNSGGPVFGLKNGKVIGMLNSGMASCVVNVSDREPMQTIEIPTGMSYGIPSWKIQRNFDNFQANGKQIIERLKSNLTPNTTSKPNL